MLVYKATQIHTTKNILSDKHGAIEYYEEVVNGYNNFLARN